MPQMNNRYGSALINPSIMIYNRILATSLLGFMGKVEDLQSVAVNATIKVTLGPQEQ
jgi:hypothetical protein